MATTLHSQAHRMFSTTPSPACASNDFADPRKCLVFSAQAGRTETRSRITRPAHNTMEEKYAQATRSSWFQRIQASRRWWRRTYCWWQALLLPLPSLLFAPPAAAPPPAPAPAPADARVGLVRSAGLDDLTGEELVERGSGEGDVCILPSSSLVAAALFTRAWPI